MIKYDLDQLFKYSVGRRRYEDIVVKAITMTVIIFTMTCDWQKVAKSTNY